jgi:hypothetical protein
MSKPTKAQTIELLDMIEEWSADENQSVIDLLKGSLTVSYNQGYIDALKFVTGKKK